MSCAWPRFQVNLRGVFDPGRDLNDRMVIERLKMVLNGDWDKMIAQVATGGRRQ